jgi:hypothetical protein
MARADDAITAEELELAPHSTEQFDTCAVLRESVTLGVRGRT